MRECACSCTTNCSERGKVLPMGYFNDDEEIADTPVDDDGDSAPDLSDSEPIAEPEDSDTRGDGGAVFTGGGKHGKIRRL